VPSSGICVATAGGVATDFDFAFAVDFAMDHVPFQPITHTYSFCSPCGFYQLHLQARFEPLQQHDRDATASQ
jgi:hypothetical protein